MSIYRVKTYDDIVQAVREELKVQSSDTVALNRIRRDVNVIYEQEVVPYDAWQWLRGKIDLNQKAFYNTGTASVTNGSVTITLSNTIAVSKRGYNFSVKGQLEIYKIAQHDAGSSTLILEAPYTQNTVAAQNFQIWTDKIALPSDCRETVTVTHDYSTTPMWSLGLQSFIEQKTAFPKAERRPEYYTTSDYIDPDPYVVIDSLPSLTSRASAGLIKILVYASDVSGLLRAGDFIEVSKAGSASYNGRFKIASVSTSTVTYTATTPITESATADLNLLLKLKDNEGDAERYREMIVHPSLYSTDVLMHIDYVKDVLPLELADDEPLMPVEDRTVLVYGALSRAWIRHGDPDEAARNDQLYQRKIMKMLGKLNDSTDMPQLVVSRNYMRSKRTSPRISSMYKWWKF